MDNVYNDLKLKVFGSADLFCFISHIYFIYFCKNSYDNTKYTYFHVTSRLSLMVPKSLMSTATVCGRAANRSLVSHETFPTTT